MGSISILCFDLNLFSNGPFSNDRPGAGVGGRFEVQASGYANEGKYIVQLS